MANSHRWISTKLARSSACCRALSKRPSPTRWSTSFSRLRSDLNQIVLQLHWLTSVNCDRVLVRLFTRTRRSGELVSERRIRMSMHWTAGLVAAGACIDAVDWAQAYETFDAAWTACQRGDYMLWWLGKTVRTDADHRAMVRIACQCARLALPHVAAGNKRPLCAIETAERWANGEPDVSLNDVRLAAAA